MRKRKIDKKYNQELETITRIMLQRIYGDEYMNNFANPQNNLQDPSSFAHLINHQTIKTPLLVPDFDKQNFHKSDTSPIPVVHPAVHKATHHPQSWDKAKKLPSPHQISETILSNRNYVIACTVIMSTIILIYMVKLVFTVMMK